MKPDFSKLVVIASPEDTLDSTLRLMAEKSHQLIHKGIALVVDESFHLIGIVTDGDVRRAYTKNVSFESPISEIMVKDPISVSSDLPVDKIIPEIYRLVRQSPRHSSNSIRHIPLVNEKGVLVDLLDFFDLLISQSGSHQSVAIFGMGYVGLTLSVALASRGHLVTGVEINRSVRAQLDKGIPHIYEPGLQEMLKSALEAKSIEFSSELKLPNNDIYIIAVGTPLDDSFHPNLEALNSVLNVIGRLLKHGDLVMLRSTIPIGTTRNIVIKTLSRLSGLEPGKNFSVAFAPERTIEGKAMHELRSLPQVIGGFSNSCVSKASQFWSTLTPSVVQVSSLEASEMVKLANNTFRDLSFAFSNELALLGHEFNVDAFDLIQAANEGYPRNVIPSPSPGVGGYCLTKDPIIYGSDHQGNRNQAVLGNISRSINEMASKYPLTIINHYCQRNAINLNHLKVLIVGLAFKGEPDTSDIRNSTSIYLCEHLKDKVYRLFVWDAVVTSSLLVDIGLNPASSLDQAIIDSDVVLILNNHRDNAKSKSYYNPSNKKLIFDGWHQLDKLTIENIPDYTYATMGYMSPHK